MDETLNARAQTALLVEEFGLLFEADGRHAHGRARDPAWLLLAEPPVQSLTEIAEGLGVSKAAVSSVRPRCSSSPAPWNASASPDSAATSTASTPRQARGHPAPRPRRTLWSASSTAASNSSPAKTRRSPTTCSCASCARSPTSSRPRSPASSPAGRPPGGYRRPRPPAPTHPLQHPGGIHVSWLTKMSLRNRSIVGLAVLAVILVGAFAITSLKQELIPDLTFPYLTVFTVDQGASPTRRRAQRHHAARAGDQDHQRRQGVRLVLQRGHEHHHRPVRVRHGHEGQGGRGPAGRVRACRRAPTTAQAPQVAALNFNTMPVVQLAVSSSLPPQQLATLLGTQVVPRLQAIPGVQAVTLSGVQQMQLQIQLKPTKVARARRLAHADRDRASAGQPHHRRGHASRPAASSTRSPSPPGADHAGHREPGDGAAARPPAAAVGGAGRRGGGRRRRRDRRRGGSGHAAATRRSPSATSPQSRSPRRR